MRGCMGRVTVQAERIGQTDAWLGARLFHRQKPGLAFDFLTAELHPGPLILTQNYRCSAIHRTGTDT